MYSNVDIEKITAYFNKPSGKVTLGIHTCIEEIWQILSTRKSSAEYVVYTKMRDFAKDVLECGEGGYSNEIIRKRRSYGGFTTNTGMAVGRLGADLTLIGMFGANSIDPVFKEFQDLYTVLSVADPPGGATYEFDDGKIILPHIEDTIDFNWDSLAAALPWEALKKACTEADIFSLGYWSFIPAFDEILEKICEHFLDGSRCKRFFFDFADIRKRDNAALRYTMGKLAIINERMPITLSLNEHEAELLFTGLGERFGYDQAIAESTIGNVRDKTGLDEIVVHTPHFAAISSYSEGVAVVPQRHCENVVRTTGAGDNFNGGYMVTCVFPGELNMHERLFVGNATTGFYVRNGYSPDIPALIQEMNEVFTASSQS
jgi:sugar/nucleoside kinase (ribokinase family)